MKFKKNSGVTVQTSPTGSTAWKGLNSNIVDSGKKVYNREKEEEAVINDGLRRLIYRKCSIAFPVNPGYTASGIPGGSYRRIRLREFSSRRRQK